MGKHYHFMLLLFASMLVHVHAADPQVDVTGVSTTGTGGNTVVQVTYRYLDSDSDTLVIGLQASSDDGATWDAVPVTTLSGDTSVSATGSWQSGTLQWAAGTDWPNQYSSQMRVRVTANDTGAPSDEFVLIPAGTNSGTDPISGAYSLTVNAFYMGKCEVTKARWDEVRAWGLNNGYTDLPEGGGKGADHPVHTVNWYDIVKWCNARSEKYGRTPCYYTTSGQAVIYRTGEIDIEDNCVKWTANGFRVPTDTEWEYAARGGRAGNRFSWGDTITHSQANYFSDSYYPYDVSPTRGYHPDYNDGTFPYTSPAGSFAANDYGLHDMAGNIREWCWNWYPGDEGSLRVVRGGHWGNIASICRSAYRYWYSPAIRYPGGGFRVCSAPPVQ